METRKNYATCLECGAPLYLEEGRSDRKFCSVTCKNRWHNRNSEPFREYRQKVLRRLDRNHSILAGLLRLGERGMGLPEVMAMGFTLTLYTSSRKKGKHVEYTCFDIKYRISESRLWAIEKIILPFSADL